MIDRPTVWQMVKEAIDELDGRATNSEIREYIHSHYSDVNNNTVNAHIITCTVNHPSRIHYTYNKKPRISNTRYDFLFRTGHGQVEKFDPKRHGDWEIRHDVEGNLVVAQIGKDAIPTSSGKHGSKEKQQFFREKKLKYGYITNAILQDRLDRIAAAPLDTIIREAGVVFEDRLRSVSGLSRSMYGTRLVDAVFKPEEGKLIVSTHRGEQEGLQMLFRGAMQFIRNPPMHNLIDYHENTAVTTKPSPVMA